MSKRVVESKDVIEINIGEMTLIVEALDNTLACLADATVKVWDGCSKNTLRKKASLFQKLQRKLTIDLDEHLEVKKPKADK